MWFPILVRWHLYIESGHRWQWDYLCTYIAPSSAGTSEHLQGKQAWTDQLALNLNKWISWQYFLLNCIESVLKNTKFSKSCQSFQHTSSQTVTNHLSKLALKLTDLFKNANVGWHVFQLVDLVGFFTNGVLLALNASGSLRVCHVHVGVPTTITLQSAHHIIRNSRNTCSRDTGTKYFRYATQVASFVGLTPGFNRPDDTGPVEALCRPNKTATWADSELIVHVATCQAVIAGPTILVPCHFSQVSATHWKISSPQMTSTGDISFNEKYRQISNIRRTK